MELIEHYQPEFVKRFDARETPCDCLACRNAPQGWPCVHIQLKNQQRESLNMACEAASREMLTNPDAFVLHTTQAQAQGDVVLSEWNKTLNQQCINLAIHPALGLEERLYAIGVLLSKARQHHDNGESDPALLVSMGEQLSSLAEQGILAQQFAMLPEITENRLAALKEMGAMRLNLNVPMAEKMTMSLQLSELAIMSSPRLADRHQELMQRWQTIELFNAQPFILTNALIYPLYHDIFPGVDCQNYGEAFLGLARQFFQFKIICAIRQNNSHELTTDDAVMLFSALKEWQQQNPFPVNTGNTADYSLLCGLSLL